MFEINYLLTFLIGLLTLISVLIGRYFTFWLRQGVKGSCLPEFGSLFAITKDFIMQSHLKYGPIYGGFFLFRKWLIVNDPEYIKTIMTKDFHIFPDHYNFNMGSSKLDKALFFMKGNEEWKRIRSILTPAFTSGKLRSMMSNISQIADKFIQNLDTFAVNGQTVDVRKYLGAFAMDVISTCAYGVNIESINNPNNPIVINAKKILAIDPTLSYGLSVLLPKFAQFLRLEPFDINAINYFDALTNQIVEERKRHSNQGKAIKRSDFIQLMIDNEKNESNEDIESNSDNELNASEVFISNNKTNNLNLSNDELTAQGILFFIAGYDTTSAALSHALYFLAQNKDCQQILANELKTFYEGFTYENLNELKYLNAVINETLRMAPPLACIQRECVEDYCLGDTGIFIPKGTAVEIHPQVVHMDPKNFADPDQFKPERFIEPSHHPYAFIPFGGGPRLCVGMRFALNEMRMCIAKIINKFEFTIAPGFKIDYFKGTILSTPKEVLVNINRRQN